MYEKACKGNDKHTNTHKKYNHATNEKEQKKKSANKLHPSIKHYKNADNIKQKTARLTILGSVCVSVCVLMRHFPTGKAKTKELKLSVE